MAEVDDAQFDALNGASACWVSADPGSVLIRRWDDESVVHVVPTGDNHLLGPASSAVLDVLLACHPACRSVAALVPDLFDPSEDGAEDGDPASDSALIHESLRGLEAIGLVRRHT